MISLPVLLTFVLSVVFCRAYRQLALRWRIFDIPNERSAHQQPTPKGGGLGLFLALLAGLWFASGSLETWPTAYSVLLPAAGCLVGVGLLDDVVGLPVRWRLLIYFLLCGGAVLWFLPPAPLFLLIAAMVYMVWMLNLYNFMDGIDGLAALEAVFVGLAAAALGSLVDAPVWQLVFCLVLSAASAGFLVWNRPPASLFMGDAGSICLGFLLASLSLLGASGDGLPFTCWLILLAVFIADASFTLLRRMAGGEALTQAHSQHLYQRLARHWGSHERVLWAVLAINLFWLLPLAAVTVVYPQWAWPTLLIAYLPLLLILVISGKLP
jgi:Fuc2NAc and GlcNAc transferase